MELENRLIKLESKLLDMDQMNLELQVKVCQQGDKVDYLMDFIKTKFGHSGDDDFSLPVEESDVSSLAEIETNPVVRIRKIKGTIANIVNQSAEVAMNHGEDDDIGFDSEAINDWSGEALNDVEQVEGAFEAVEPIPGSSKGQQIQKKKNKRHPRRSRSNAVRIGWTLGTGTQQRTATSLSSLTQHVEKRFVCDWPNCGKQFRQNVHLTVHKRVHTGEKPFACDFPDCPKRFSQNSALNLHKKIHTGEKLFACHYPDCLKRFSENSYLKIHKRIHTGEKPFVCPWPNCGRGFTDKSNLTVHSRTHTGEKRFRCTYCARTLASKIALEGHVRIHTGETPFSCNLCGKSFKSNGALCYHKRLHP